MRISYIHTLIEIFSQIIPPVMRITVVLTWGQRLNSESFALNTEESEEYEKEDIGDPYDYLQTLLENCLQKRTIDRATGDLSLRKKLTNEHQNEFKEVIKVCSDRFFSPFFPNRTPRSINDYNQRKRAISQKVSAFF